MNPLRPTVSSAALPILPIALAVFLIVAPFLSPAAQAQAPKQEQQNEEDEDRGRGGLGWTGIGLISAGGLLLAGSFTFNDSKGCGFFNELACRDVGRVYGIGGGTMVATGVAFLVIDGARQARAARPGRQTAIAIGPRAIQVRVMF